MLGDPPWGIPNLSNGLSLMCTFSYWHFFTKKRCPNLLNMQQAPTFGAPTALEERLSKKTNSEDEFNKAMRGGASELFSEFEEDNASGAQTLKMQILVHTPNTRGSLLGPGRTTATIIGPRLLDSACRQWLSSPLLVSG